VFRQVDLPAREGQAHHAHAQLFQPDSWRILLIGAAFFTRFRHAADVLGSRGRRRPAVSWGMPRFFSRLRTSALIIS
jgi:hypothetical protein